MIPKPHLTHQVKIILLAGVIATIASTAVLYEYYLYAQTLLVCPGCNVPEQIFLDHYAIYNNTSQQPSILTIWFRSTGRADQKLLMNTLWLTDNNQTSYPNPVHFDLGGVTINGNTMIQVSIDTSTSGLYLTTNHNYSVRLITDKYDFTLGPPIYYPARSYP